MRIFNKDGIGAKELFSVLGMIGRDVTFEKWEPMLPLGIRDLKAIIGDETMAALCDMYETDVVEDVSSYNTELIRLSQQAVGCFTWLKMIPTLDAQHDDSGRARRLGENEKGLTALQEFKDEENIRRLAYEATDALIEAMEVLEYRPWLDSRKYKQREGLLVKSKEDFDDYYHIGSHRLFVTLLPILREVQENEIAPILGTYLSDVLTNTNNKLREPSCRALILLTMKKAVERLPVEVIPEGVVQVQQSQPVKQRLKAEQQARTAVATSLGDDARRYLDRLQALVAELENRDTEFDDTIPGPIVHTRGLTF